MISHAFQNALRSIWTKKTRSFLTMLGVIIGVAQIVALIGLGNGIKKDVTSQITDLGTNILFVLSGKVENANGGINPAASVGASTLTEQDVAAIRAIAEVKDVVPLGLTASVPAVDGKPAIGTIVMASEANFLQLMTMYHLTAGHFFTAADNAAQAKNIVLGKETVATLFPNVGIPEVVGKTVQLGKETFTVVGIMEMSQTSSLFSGGGSSSGGLAIIPYATAKSLNPNTQIIRIGVKASDTADAKKLKNTIATTLKDLHGADDVTVFTQDDILKVVDNILSLITTAIVALASISLIVGGIGIMNIMLVAVSERTKEIGLRKALGATRASILLQFLTESAIISLFGGAIGVAIVSIVSVIVKIKMALSIVINLNSILLAILFSLGVGIVFGLLPAYRAARKDPIDALRYE